MNNKELENIIIENQNLKFENNHLKISKILFKK